MAKRQMLHCSNAGTWWRPVRQVDKLRRPVSENSQVPHSQPLDPCTRPGPLALNALPDSTTSPIFLHSSFCSFVTATSGHLEQMLSAVQKCEPGRCVLSQILTDPDSGTSSRQHCLPTLPQSAVLRVQIPRGSPAAKRDACQEPCTAQHSTGQHRAPQGRARMS
jgi:hypothetical protein